MPHEWNHRINSSSTSKERAVTWSCVKCGLGVLSNKDYTRGQLDAECIFQGRMYESCENYIEYMAKEIHEC